jgi:hypothetical protein
VPRPVRDTDALQELHRLATGVLSGRAEQQGGQLDVLDRGELVDEMKRLEDEADVPAPEHRPFGLGQAIHALA